MNRYLVTIIFRDGLTIPDKIADRLKQIGETRAAIPGRPNDSYAIFFLRTQLGCQGVAAELKGVSSDSRKPKQLPVIGEKDELLVIEVGENTIVPSEGIKMWLFRK